jgi:hypothetical protein
MAVDGGGQQTRKTGCGLVVAAACAERLVGVLGRVRSLLYAKTLEMAAA